MSYLPLQKENISLKSGIMSNIFHIKVINLKSLIPDIMFNFKYQKIRMSLERKPTWKFVSSQLLQELLQQLIEAAVLPGSSPAS